MADQAGRLTVMPHDEDDYHETGARTRAGGWSAPVVVPASLDGLHGPSRGRLTLPVRVYSSAGGQRRVWDLDDPASREELYSVVMENAELPDVLAYLDAGLLRAMWPTMTLSPHVRRAWAPLLDTTEE